jgi:hypothetical protein
MNCKNEWNTEFIDATFSKYFRTTVYKEYRENLLLEREKSFLPETQIIIEMNREQKEIVKKELDKYRKQRDGLSELIRIKSKQYVKLTENPGLTLDDITIDIKRTHQYYRKCPEMKCRGFVNNRNVCGICKCKVCPLCLEKINDSHKCNQDTIETIKSVQKECKSCPNCHIMIYKIDGCNQMWCTQCHNAFDWKTREIIKNRSVHNPHYFEFMNSQNDSTQRDIQINDRCQENIEDRLPTIYQVQQYFRQNEKIKCHIVYFLDILRAMLHISNVEIYRYPVYTEEQLFHNNMILRIQYLNQELTEKMFKTILLRNEKQREKNKAIRLLFEMLVNTFICIFQELFTYSTLDKIEECILIKIKNLRSYVNQHLEIISRNFNSRKIVLNDVFEINYVS